MEELGYTPVWWRRRRSATAALLLLIPSPLFLLLLLRLSHTPHLRAVAVNLLLSALAFLATLRLVPRVAAKTLSRGLYGLDINKRGTPAGALRIPEAVGLAPGVAFLGACILSQWWLGEGGAAAHAALGCCSAALLLGFVDDVLDVPWRVKLLLPALAALPLLSAYTGPTGVVVPLPLRPLLGGAAFLQLGALYKAYMLALAVFATNSINILAGVNGLEAGQTLVLALACCAHNLAQLGGGAGEDPVRAAAHALSFSLVAPLAGATAGLLCFNAYPAQVFVGDTFTLFAGMALAVAGCLGHYSETLLLFFAPQVFNFLFSLPQLAKFVPCPRHRLPRRDPATGLLHGSNDLNLLNLSLRLGGPRSERDAAQQLLALQALCALATFGLRWALAGYYKP